RLEFGRDRRLPPGDGEPARRVLADLIERRVFRRALITGVRRPVAVGALLSGDGPRHADGHHQHTQEPGFHGNLLEPGGLYRLRRWDLAALTSASCPFVRASALPSSS